MIAPQITYSNFFKFKVKIIYIPSSLNRIGIDPLPRFHMEASELLEVMAYSKRPGSTDDGYQRDKATGLYLKNRRNVDIEEINAQFALIQTKPPYGYNDVDTYSDFIRLTMDSLYSAEIEGRYNNSGNPKIEVKAEDDEDIGVDYIYTESESWITRKFQKNNHQLWPKEKGVTIGPIE